MTDAELLVHLTELEIALMRRSAASAGHLHPQAEEVGRSGRCYDLAALRQCLAEAPPSEARQPQGFQLHRLSPEIALLRYRSEHEGSATERSSFWQLHAGEWRLRFHQGTPA